MTAAPAVVGIDVGGTKIVAGLVSAGRELLATARAVTPARALGERALEDAIDALLVQVREGHEVGAVGLAAAGFVDASGDAIRFAPHLAWRDAPVRTRLTERWALPVVLDNDATAATHAEASFGAAAGADQALLITVGTGIGGGFVVDGRVVRGRNGMAGEFGHMRLVPDGVQCPCGGRGCWEQYASGNALQRFAREALARGPSILADLCGGDPAALTGPMVSEAAEQGDTAALAAFSKVGDWLGVGLTNVVAALDPAVVVVGGGVAAAGDRLLEPARHRLQHSLVGAGHRDVPPVLPAGLGPDAGLLGAADLARRFIER
ncbi:ROK family protein [Nocardioides daejeonensis]|uniref:ROK family protein n=1 Tax=Nocardioides daejeonensis TaxID=1046556 RepID=UPI000D74C3D3|nr:ROK family protein [Nocardioides daejeonensis]